MRRMMILACLPMAPLAAQEVDPLKFLSKDAIETPIREATEASRLTPHGAEIPSSLVPPDMSKVVIELAIKKYSVGSSPKELGAAEGPVQPGLVRWHESFDAAREASLVTGKPVLLFQLLGRLDEEFC